MIDSHCHINDQLYVNEAEQYIKDATEAGVFSFLVVGSNLNDSILAKEIAEKFNCCYVAVGIHPSDVKTHTDDDYKKIEELAKSDKVKAIGEIGLDYYWDKDEKVRKEQQEAFIKQIDIANKLNLPISIHCRDAIEDCYKIVKEHPVKKGGVMHCFAGSYEMAKEFIKLGFLIGIGGVVTFKNAVKIKEVAKQIPDDSFILETDAPYLTPEPFRGQENHSKYLKYIQNYLAELRGVSALKIDELTTNNFKRVFLDETKN